MRPNHYEQFGPSCGTKKFSEFFSPAKLEKQKGHDVFRRRQDVHMYVKKSDGNIGQFAPLFLLPRLVNALISTLHVEAVAEQNKEELKEKDNCFFCCYLLGCLFFWKIQTLRDAGFFFVFLFPN